MAGSKLVLLISREYKRVEAIVKVDADLSEARIDKIISNVKYIQGDDWTADDFAKALGTKLNFSKHYI